MDKYTWEESPVQLKLSNQARDNLVSEISILKALEHPHIVRMLDFTWDASFVYIIMEFCGGGDLSRYLRLKRRLDELLVQRFLQQLALALQYLKSKNIVHMDLKPQNILLTSINNPSLKLADFGFAQCIKETAKKNEVRGTLLYMAPEIFCEGFYHPSCDLWSIGIILYECLFGTTPYGQITIEKLKEKLVAVDEQIKLPSTNEISKPCAALIHGLLKRNPSERLKHEQFFSHPFIDLDHAPSAQSLDKAAEYLKRAPQLQSLGKLCEAYDCYLEGLNHLMAAYNYEPSRFKKSQIRNLMKDHLLKTESLKLELCLLSHTDVTSSSLPQLEPKTLNSQAVNLPDPIVPVKCYDVSRQPKKNADSSKKGLFHYLPKETYQPQDSGTSDSVEQINVCLSSDKAGVLTRIKHWFSRQNDKTENPYEYSGKASTSSNIVVEFLDKFYKLISRHHLQEALIYFQNEFSNCLKEAQNDSNSKNRSILFKELNLAMDKAEQIKATLNCNSTMMISENESSSFQIGEEVLDENPQEEDQCLLM
ncbi:unnamed protein product [Schistosoma intercalatum]|nr:unnamed protein product [Schistosoma intercalatum]